MSEELPRGPAKAPPPVDLKPPGSVPGEPVPSRARRLLVGLGLLALLVLAVTVLFMPRSLPPEHAVLNEVAQEGEAARMAERAVDTQPSSAARRDAEDALRELLRLRALLELARAPTWGDPEWGDAMAKVQLGDRLFLQRDFADADVAYRAAIDQLHGIESTRTQRLESALRLGEQALAEDRHEDAVDQFEQALAIETGQTDAEAGLARATVRAQVLALMDTGRTAEQQDELAAAQTAYDEAIQLDASYWPAAEARQRVVLQIEQQAFEAAMSAAIRALDEGRYGESDQALQTAAGLRPADESVRDLRRRLAAARKQARLAELRSKALSKAAAEDWQAAVNTYAEALKLDANATFAVAGIDLARGRLQVHRQVDYYLASPERLTSEEPLANAERVLLAADEAPTDEPVLADKLETLRQIVVRAKTPVLVQLQSDGRTDVVIYRVGRQGRFLQQQIELRPGTYTAIGSRMGYRDVRRQFVVEPDSATVVVSIRCEEPI